VRWCGVQPERRAELAANLQGVRLRIDAACADAGRPAGDVHLIAVTKTFPAADVVLLAELGVRDVGENRDQEAAPKVAQVKTAGEQPVRWHFIGALQTNKCASVATYASVVHSVDRFRLVDALERAVLDASQPLRCLIQVDLDDVSRAGRSGARPEDVESLAAAIEASPHLSLGGVMAVAPLGGQPAAAFAKLAVVADTVRQLHPEATMISAGMSADLETAVANGATHLRVGAALLGVRRHPVG
jgi:pyridoxal phosphate enzyme (YggS family)